MPHMTLEYSANLAEKTDIQAAVDAAHRAVLDSGLFELGAVRVRAYESDAYGIADRHPDNAFVHLCLRIGAGRAAAEKRAAGDVIYRAMLAQFEPLLASPYFALSFEICEIDAALSWKTNAMHERLRPNASGRM